MNALISEFQPNPNGADPSNVTIELSGLAGDFFSGVLLSIESDPTTVGTVDRLDSVSGTFDANGLLTVEIPDLENPSFTFVLVDAFTGAVGDDFDTDDDGTADFDLASVGIGTVFDAIGVPDAVGDEGFLYGAQLGGTDFAFTGDEPRLIFRSGSTGDLFAVNDPDNGEVIDVTGAVVDVAEFDIDPTLGFDTFGAINPVFGSEAPTAPQATGDLVISIANTFQGESDPLNEDSAEGASEVVAHEVGKLYVTNGNLDRIDVFDIAGKALDGAIPLDGLDGYDGVKSVAVSNGIVAVAISRAPTETTVFGQTVSLSEPGFIALFDAATLGLISTVDVGNLPGQLTFSADGSTLLVAGEGENNVDSEHDDNPLGTVAIIDVSDPSTPFASIVDFTQFNGLETFARDAGLRIQEGVSLAEDLEPEYITISPDSSTAYVGLQENNAIVSIDIATGSVIDFFGLGTTDFSQTAFDPLDDGIIDIRTFDNVVGFRMPDAIVAADISGATFILTANEGDSRDFDEARVFDLATDGLLDPTMQQELIDLGQLDLSNQDFGLGRLEVSSIDGDTDGDGDIDVIHSFSSRSFSIFDEDGNLVFDSGSEFEQIIADLAPERFNDDDGDDGEDRSDAKGPEPEAIEVGQIGDSTYAFIGLERDSGIMIYNIDDPANAFFVDYIEPLHIDNAAEGEIARHGPEIIEFIAAEDSTSGVAQIAVSYEISGSTVVYDLAEFDPITPIAQIQGASHVSTLAGETVTTSGIVTAVDFNGYYLQDPEGDGDDATSEGIFVFTGNGIAQAIVSVGDEVEITGEVSEFIPGGAASGNLSTTQISASEATVLSSGNVIEAVVIGATRRTPPTNVVISPDETPVNLQTDPGVFNPDVDGIDFYESLEGMLVTVDNPVVIAATNRFDETWVVADDGANVTSGGQTGGLNDRGALVINADADGLGDLNPERIQIQYDAFFDLLPEGFTPPDLNIGDDLSDVTGVVGYSFGNFEINVTAEFLVETPTTNVAEVTEIAADDDTLTVATYNVLNVTANPDDGDADQIATLGQHIATNLGSPDIVALQEIQDDSGVTDDGTLGADATLQAIIDSIVAAGGPTYTAVSAVVDVDGENGGVPGGNIRNAFLVNEDRVTINEVTTLESDVLAGFGVTNADAFEGTRDPLLGTFEFNGQEITLINNHFSSRFGSEPVFGGPQPFNQGGEDAREQQSLTINEVVDALLVADPDARVSVLGDLNTFEFTDELAEDLPGVGDEQVLTNLVGNLTEDDGYTFVFQGNAQNLDHVFATDNLLEGAEIDIVHVNTDFAAFASDHEPIVVSFEFEVEEVEDLVLVGTFGKDELVGGEGDDDIFGLFNHDDLSGEGGDDDIFGGFGMDDIDGGEGDDNLFGGFGGDSILGGAGADFIDGGAGRDEIDGGFDNDNIFGGFGRDSLSGGDGDDSIQGGFGRDVINGGAGDDGLTGGRGADQFIFDGIFGDDAISDFDVRRDDLVFENLAAGDLAVLTEGDDTVLVATGAETSGSVRLTGVSTFDEDSLIFA